jgi:MoaA/NifB/PqqE/SkfB family radical SAM enzyme
MGRAVREGLPFGKETPIEVIEKIGKDGLSGGVSDVCLFPTYKCDLNCYMCHVQHTRGKDDPYLSPGQLKVVFDDVKVTTMFHLGGEPFVRPEMMEILKYFDSRGTNQIISTNGTNVTETMAEELARLKHLVCVQVSLNGTGENDNIIRGSSKAFETTVEGIKILKKAGLQTWIHSVVLNENIDDLANIVRLGGELGVGMVNFLFGQMMSAEEAKETKDVIRKWIGEEVDIGGYIGEIAYSKEQLINSVNAAKEEGKRLGLQVMFFPRVFGDKPELYWDGTLLEQERPICQMTLMPPLTPIVGPEGDVYGCCIVNKSFGNVKEQSLEEIWDSPTVRAFRRGLINDKLMPVCKRCPSGDIIDLSAPRMQLFADLAAWEAYLERLTKALNDIPDLSPVLNNIAPVMFQYEISDRPEYNYWHIFEKDKVRLGLGKNTGDNFLRLIHKTDFDTLNKVNAGEINPVQATMDGTYAVDGEMSKLMACAPLIPLTIKAHGIAIADVKDTDREG